MFSLISTTVASTILLISTSSDAFQLTSPILAPKSQQIHHGNTIHRSQQSPTTVLHASEAEELLKEDYPIFYNLVMSKSTDTSWKSNSADGGFTIFAPNDEAMEKLGKQKLDQLLDDRNRETAEKIASFHTVDESVGAWDLINSGGIKTLGGEVPVGKSKVGGFLGWGGKEDGGITVNGAKILQTRNVDSSGVIVHEMDGLINPELLWRYMDQLRIL